MQSDTIKVPGGTLYYELRGAGPVLLLIPGGPMDAGGFAPLAERLADRYTVVTYDCRGNSRSSHEGAPEELTVGLHADDADRLLEVVGAERAYVLGSSGGAIYGLDLVARYPGRVATLVAHEPPVSSLLSDADRWRAFNEEIGATYRRDGAFAAMAKFGAGTGLGGGPSEQPTTPEAIEAAARMMGNLELFMGHLIPVVGNHTPDVAALRASSTRIVVGVGEASTPAQLPHRTAHVLAEALGRAPVTFPGDHGGFSSNPEAFAARLQDVLSGAARQAA
jgi:pimeloyl-ACP methyl ester carboxylesterase